MKDKELEEVAAGDPNNDGVVGMMLLMLEEDVDPGIGIRSICIAAAFCCSAAAFCCSAADKAAAAWAIAALCAAVKPGNTPANPRLGRVAAAA